MLKQTAKKKAGYIYERKTLSDNNRALYEQIIEDCKPTNTKGNAMKTIALKVNRIKNTLMSKIDKMFESIGYYFKGFKYDIKQNNSLILELKSQVNNLEEVDTSDIEYRLDELEYYDISSMNDKIEEVEDAICGLDSNDNIKDIKSDINTLDGRIKSLEDSRGALETLEEEVKEINATNNLSVALAEYIADSVDVFDYDYKSIKQDILLALVDCKEFEITIKRVNK